MNANHNLMTASVYSTGGFFGPATAVPSWGSFGNAEANNTWADGPSQGTSFL
jgi:hypothetical protein